METETLIDRLAGDIRGRRSPAFAPERMLAATALAAFAVTLALIVMTLGMRADLSSAIASAPVLVKFLAALALACGAFLAAARSSRPDGGGHNLVWALPGTLVLSSAFLIDPGSANPFGRSTLSCVALVAAFSLLPLAAILAVLRRGASTSPATTGAAAGLFAGGIGAFAYAFHCPFDSGSFIALGYGAAFALLALLGSLLGRRVLAW